MWKWDQGRMEYFQYDVLKEVSRFVVNNQWTRENSTTIRSKTGLKFPVPNTHSPWRNYLKVFKLCFLVSEKNGVAVSTSVAKTLVHSATPINEVISGIQSRRIRLFRRYSPVH